MAATPEVKCEMALLSKQSSPWLSECFLHGRKCLLLHVADSVGDNARMWATHDVILQSAKGRLLTFVLVFLSHCQPQQPFHSWLKLRLMFGIRAIQLFKVLQQSPSVLGLANAHMTYFHTSVFD